MTKMRFANRTAALAATAVLLATPQAFAHAVLVTASPATDATVAPPESIRLKFSEGLEPRFSGFELSRDGKSVALAKVAFDPADKATMTATPQTALAPGTYKVTWHAVGPDLHKMEGAFSFTVK